MQPSLSRAAIALSTGLAVGTSALMAVAQTTTITPEGATSSITTMEAAAWPTLTTYATDEEVADDLTDQGYTNVAVSREGGFIVVQAERAGTPTDVIFSEADGTLLIADGVQIHTPTMPIGASTDDEDGPSDTTTSPSFDAPAGTSPAPAGDEQSGTQADGGAETDGQG